MSQQERQRHGRLPKEAVTTCQEITYPLGQEPEVEIRMRDVSEAGVGFDSPRPFTVGIPIQIALVLQGWQKHTSGFLKYGETALSKPLTAVGRVARCRPLEGGITRSAWNFWIFRKTTGVPCVPTSRRR